MTEPKIDVGTLVLAMDASARAAVQGEMQRLAGTGDTKSKEGLASLLRESVAVLRAHEASFTHSFAESTRPLPPDLARKRFVDAAHRARARFEVEVIRNADGTTTKAEPRTLGANPEPGVVLVTAVVARNDEIRDVPEHPDRAGIRALLDDFARTTAASLVAIEVIWSPAVDADRVSAAQLEARHPEIRRLA